MSTTTQEPTTLGAIFGSLENFFSGAVDTVAKGVKTYYDSAIAYTEADAALQSAKNNLQDQQIVNQGIEQTVTSTGTVNLSTKDLLLIGGGALVLIVALKK